MTPLPRLDEAAAADGLLTVQIGVSTPFAGACELPIQPLLLPSPTPAVADGVVKDQADVGDAVT
jgi:hypothetical protein